MDLLPTISEMQEGDQEDGDPEFPTHSMEEYVDSIKELSQPASYPLHGPLKGHRLWVTRPTSHPTGGHPIVTTVLPFPSSMAYAPWAPLGLSHVSLMVAHQSDCSVSFRPPREPVSWLFAQSQFVCFSLLGSSQSSV